MKVSNATMNKCIPNDNVTAYCRMRQQQQKLKENILLSVGIGTKK